MCAALEVLLIISVPRLVCTLCVMVEQKEQKNSQGTRGTFHLEGVLKTCDIIPQNRMFFFRKTTRVDGTRVGKKGSVGRKEVLFNSCDHTLLSHCYIEKSLLTQTHPTHRSS